MLKLYTTSLRSKILLGFMVILIIMFFATLWSVYNFYALNESIKRTMQENYASIIAADNMGRALDEQLHAIIIMMNQNFEEGEKILEKNKLDFYFWYENARESASSVDEKNILDTINIDYQKFIKDISDKIDYSIYFSIRSQELKNNFITIVNEIKEIKRKTNRILEINHAQLNGAVSRVKEITQSATILILIILIGAIGVSLSFGSKFSDYIVKPIAKLRQSVTHISEGDFNERIEIDENADEISGLAEEFNKMSEKLQMYEQLNLNKILYEKKKSELIIESINEPVLMIDENFNVMLSNKTFNEVFGKNFLTQHDIKNILSSKPYGKTTLTTQISKDLYQKEDIVKIKYSSGEQKYFKLIAASLEIPESGMKGTVIVFNDITRYQELDRMKSEFIAKVSHELKTPLTSIGMALGIMEDGVAGKLSEKQKEMIGSMKEDYTRLSRLVYEILELARLEANMGKMRFERFDAKKLCENVLKKFSIQAKEKKINLLFEDKSESAVINCHFDYLISALENLITNSLRYTPPKGEIKILLYEKNKSVIMEISDTGIGIDPENLSKIFDKFIQLDDPLPGSLGLGLSIAKEIVEIHNGEISAFSETGKGSTFQIKLPAA